MTYLTYPVGGPREPVYQLMQSLGFTMAPWSDKHWVSRDGYSAVIYGAGSQVCVHYKPIGAEESRLAFDGPLDKLSMYLR